LPRSRRVIEGFAGGLCRVAIFLEQNAADTITALRELM
jgi:hypothetical protein